MHTAVLLAKVGDKNTFQIYSIVFVCLKWLIVSLTVFLPSYLLMTPTFTCGSRTSVNEVDACPIIDQCYLDHPYTITAYTGLYCNDKYIRNAIISSQFVGSVVGLVLLSILADKLGRKLIIVSTLCITAIGVMVLTLGTYYKQTYLLFMGMIMMGFGGYSLSMVSYSYLSEVNNDLWRQKSLILTYSFWALGQIALYPIVTYISNWESICFYILVLPLACLIIMSTFIVQTPQFLYVKGRYSQCLESLNGIAKFNGRQLLTTLGQIQQQKEEPQRMRDAFSRQQFLLPLIVLSFAQICNNGYYYTAQYSLNDYGYKFELNMLIIGCLELISCLVTNLYCEKMHRKRWILIFMCLSGTMGLLIQLTDSTSAVEIVFLGISRLFNTVAFALFSLICSQSFPTAIKSTGMGITQAASNLGNMGAPFLVLLAQSIGVKAVFIGGIINIAGGISMLLVKQTKIDKKDETNPLLAEEMLDEQDGDKSHWSVQTK